MASYRYLPAIDIRLLQRAGLFKSSPDQFIVVQHHLLFKISFNRSCSWLEVQYFVEDLAYSNLIQVGFVHRRNGTTAILICSASGKRSKVLYLVRGRFVCSSAVSGSCEKSPDRAIRDRRRLERKRRRYEGKDGNGPARGKKGERILADYMQGDELAWAEWPTLKDEIDKLEKRRLRVANRTPSLIKTGPLSTAVGIRVRFETHASIVEQGINYPEGPARAFDLGGPEAFIGDCPAIDLATLIAKMRGEKLELASYDLYWYHEPQALSCQVHLTVDLRDRSNSGMELHIMAGVNAGIGQHAKAVTR